MRSNMINLVTEEDMSASFKSKGIDLSQIVLYSIQAVWTGSPVGSFTLEVSNDNVQVAASATNPIGNDPAANVVNWTTYTGSETDVSGAGDFLWNVLESGYRWVRLSYTRTSGTGSVSASMTIKGV